MMTGRKGELFMLDLSFAGWALLGILPVIGWAVNVWNLPYFETTYALYYEQLSGRSIGGDRGYNPGFRNGNDYDNSIWM